MPSHPPAFSVADPNTATLGVTVSGPNKYTERTTGYHTYRASVTGGVGPYYFDWYAEYCYTLQDCYGPAWVGGGWGDSTHVENLILDYRTVRVYAHVYDSQAPYAYAGQSNVRTINFSTATSDGGIVWNCTIGGTYYPVLGSRYDDYGSPMGDWHYRRNLCTGAREYSPTP